MKVAPPGGVVPGVGAGGVENMAVWLFIYGVGIVPALLVLSLIAFIRRESHQMSRRSVAQLAASAGLVWPLLAVAVVQIGGLLVLKAALGLVRGRDDAVHVAEEMPAVPVVQPMVAVAAA